MFKNIMYIVYVIILKMIILITAPKHVIYDNACKLQDYCLNRDPCFFQHTEFYVDRLHWDNHTSKLIVDQYIS